MHGQDGDTGASVTYNLKVVEHELPFVNNKKCPSLGESRERSRPLTVTTDIYQLCYQATADGFA